MISVTRPSKISKAYTDTTTTNTQKSPETTPAILVLLALTEGTISTVILGKNMAEKATKRTIPYT